MKPTVRVAALAFVVLIGTAVGSPAQVERLELVHHGVVAESRGFGTTGPYEKLTGKMYLAIDPADESNARVVDLELAPRDPDGLVRYAADIFVLRPVRPERGNGALLLEVCNRGGKAIVRYFNRGAPRTLDPTTAADFGDGFLLRHGYTLAWIGWQHDVPEREDLLRLHAVRATASDPPIRGLVRADRVFDEPSSQLDLGHRGHLAYPFDPGGPPAATLTVRDAPTGPREVIRDKDWAFEHVEGRKRIPDPTTVHSRRGFEPGRIYEVVYPARDPVVAGLGLTAIRDAVSYLKHNPASPIKVDRALAVGISQTGRFLRHFLYQGFNADLDGRRVLDGVLAHTAGAGRGSFNHRFAQPSRDAHAFSAFLFPTDVFPFSAVPQTDHESGRTEGLLDLVAGSPAMPRLMLTNTGYEYWGRAAALIHTTVDGTADLAPHPDLRLYSFASTQHFVGSSPPRPRGTLHPENSVDFLWSLRALIQALDRWVALGAEPPPSRTPKISEGTLVPPGDLRFPAIPGASPPDQPHRAYRVDYGPRFLAEGIVDFQPPRVGAPFPVLVPQVDADGNEIGGIRMPEIQVPVATWTPWNLRDPATGAAGQMANFRGSYLPFPRTSADARRTNDPRLPIADRYLSQADYLGRYAMAALGLVDAGYLLPEDLGPILHRGEELWVLTAGKARDPSMTAPGTGVTARP